jgi:membrane protein DedA with SNARE-associated domain
MILGLHIGATPEALALSILVSTFFLEDAAIGYAALLATGGMIGPRTAFIVLFLGIYFGDLGLYFLGAAARRYAPARRQIGEGRLARAHRWLGRHVLLTLIGARLVPGSRLPVYAASGFLQVPLAAFAATTGVASLVWTGVLFSVIYFFGLHATELFGAFKYAVAAIFIAVVVIGPILSARWIGREPRHV